MTKQEFYEECILKTYQNLPSEGPLSNDLEKIGGTCPKSFNELIMKLSIAGLHEIPIKPDYDSWGFEYIKQLIGFVIHLGDYQFTKRFFEFINKPSIKKIVDPKSQDNSDALYDFYYETLFGGFVDQDFCELMADYILKNCEGTQAHKKVLHLSFAFGLTKEVNYHEMVEMKRNTIDHNDF